MGDLNRGVILEQAAAMKALFDEQAELLIELEERIAQVGKVLRLSQPPADGKVDIRWWTLSRAAHRTPVLVKWVLTRMNRYKVKQPKRVDVRTDGSFALNARETKVLVEHAQKLIAERAVMVLRFRDMLRDLARINQRVARELTLSYGLVDAEHTRIVKHLEDAGYVVENHLRPEGWRDEDFEEDGV